MWHTFGFEIVVAPIYLNIELPNKIRKLNSYREFRDIKYLSKLSSVIKINLSAADSIPIAKTMTQVKQIVF